MENPDGSIAQPIAPMWSCQPPRYDNDDYDDNDDNYPFVLITQPIPNFAMFTWLDANFKWERSFFSSVFQFEHFNIYRVGLKGVCWFVSILVIFYWDIGRPDISLAYWQSRVGELCIVYMRRYQPQPLLTPNTATIVTSNIAHSSFWFC